jgi:hypothetical protein
MPLANPFLSLIASRLLFSSSIGVQVFTLIVLASLLPMKSYRVVCSLRSYLTGTCWYRFYVSNFGTDLFLVVGVALAAQDMKCSRKQ